MKELKIRLDGKPVPQGRPRFSVRGKGTKQFVQVYYSDTSNIYRAVLVAAVKEAVGKAKWKPCKHTMVSIYPCGMRKGSDLDNMAKQVLDALVDGGALTGDDWEKVPLVMVSARGRRPDVAPHVVVFLNETTLGTPAVLE